MKRIYPSDSFTFSDPTCNIGLQNKYFSRDEFGEFVYLDEMKDMVLEQMSSTFTVKDIVKTGKFDDLNKTTVTLLYARRSSLPLEW